MHHVTVYRIKPERQAAAALGQPAEHADVPPVMARREGPSAATTSAAPSLSVQLQRSGVWCWHRIWISALADSPRRESGLVDLAD